MVKIWSEVLDVEQIGIDDDFLELGGHSLQAVQIISRVIGVFRVNLPIQTLFDTPTIAGMALIIIENISGQIELSEMERMLDAVESVAI